MTFTIIRSRVLLTLFAALVGGMPLQTGAEDIDIFVGAASNLGTQGAPNVLIVLDNTSNWSRSSEGWPGMDQAHAEVSAIKRVLANLSNINVGLMFINNNQGSSDQGSYVNFAVKFMEPAAAPGNNKYALNQRLDAIYSFGNLNPTKWNSSSSISYGGVMFDVFKYFGGYTSAAGAQFDATHFGPIAYQGGATPVGQCDGCPAGVPMQDPAAYTLPNPITTATTATQLTNAPLTFRPPGSDIAETCGSNNFLIFVTNKAPNSDTNSATLLTNVGGTLSPRVPRPVIVTTTVGGINYYSPDPAGGEITPADSWYMPEWARFLRKTDVNSLTGVQNVVTYVINTYHNGYPQLPGFSQMLMATAKAGGGKYYAATDNAQLDAAFQAAFAEIQAKGTTFASASLPISSTNRAQNANQVFIGMFHPDSNAQPRWYGNLKRYQLGRFSSGIRLADALGQDAVNNNTGFVGDCGVSYWTTDSAAYWANVAETPPPIGACPINLPDPTTGTTIAHDKWSDYPDGPWVEKGAVAEVLRKRDTATSPRVLKTSAAGSSTALTNFNTSNATLTAAGLTTNDINFIIGKDLNDENGDASATDNRSSIHGDVVHSRPLPVNYGATTGGTVLYYGSNDGTLRAIDADTGVEKWAYIAPEFYPTGASPQPLSRLRTQTPPINYPTITDPSARPKNYFFDGSIGLRQSADNSNIWIFPTMRRGGRMIYAFDVSPAVASLTATPPALPTMLWKKGCPNLADDVGCSTSMSDIGQTWSVPVVARVKDGSTTRTVVLVGGGYDTCEDSSASSPACTTSGQVTSAAAKGNRVYVLDATDGSVIKSFTTDGRVPSDIGVIDVDYDGLVDYAYVGDTKGNVYRIAFGLSKTAPLNFAQWTAPKIASTTSFGRKFLYPPALVSYTDRSANKTYVYVALGSGDREKPLITQYPYTEDIKNRFYVYLDDITVASPTVTDLDDTSAMKDFTTDPFVTGQTGCPDGVVPGSSSQFASKKGWFLQYSGGTGNGGNQGEQTVTSAIIVGGQLAFSTNRPIQPVNGLSCAPQGEAKGYWMSLFNASGSIGAPGTLACGGERFDTFVGGGLPPSPVVGTVVINGVPATVVVGAADKAGGLSSIISGQEGFTLPPQKRTRVYWKQDIDN